MEQLNPPYFLDDMEDGMALIDDDDEEFELL